MIYYTKCRFNEVSYKLYILKLIGKLYIYVRRFRITSIETNAITLYTLYQGSMVDLM